MLYMRCYVWTRFRDKIDNTNDSFCTCSLICCTARIVALNQVEFDCLNSHTSTAPKWIDNVHEKDCKY